VVKKFQRNLKKKKNVVMKTNKDNFGDRMKMYENQTCGIKLIPRIPVIARLDGKGFSKFTKGLKRPYDERLSKLMVETTKYLVKETNANCGYTQSDEITLMWYTDKIESSIYFDGRLFKMLTDLSAMASVFFNRKLGEYLPEKADKMPRFDARVYNVPTLDEAVNSFLWREQDATKNSISMAAQHYYSHSELMGKNGSDKQEMLFKRGSYVQRRRVVTPFTSEEIEKLPIKHNARKDLSFVIERWVIDTVELPRLSSIENSVDVVIWGKEPKLKSPVK